MFCMVELGGNMPFNQRPPDISLVPGGVHEDRSETLPLPEFHRYRAVAGEKGPAVFGAWVQGYGGIVEIIEKLSGCESMEGNTYDEKYNVLSRTGTFHYVIFQLIVHEQDTAGPLRFQFCCLCLDKFPSVDILSLYRHSGVTGT